MFQLIKNLCDDDDNSHFKFTKDKFDIFLHHFAESISLFCIAKNVCNMNLSTSIHSIDYE